MKDREKASKTQKYFDFSKMDKKNVQNREVKNVLTDEKFCLDIEKLWSQIKPKKIFCDDIFFEKKLKNIFSMEINGNFRK